MDNTALSVATGFVIGLILSIVLFPEVVARWVFDYQSALFELQYQAAKEMME